MKKLFALILALFFFTRTVPISAAEDTLVIRSGSGEEKKIALTFDDGPHPVMTDKILDILEEYDIPATFFVIGENAVNYPAPLRRAVALGHEIGNHTFSHKHIANMSRPYIEKELSDTETVITAISGAAVTLFRPPEGNVGGAVLEAAAHCDYRVILWTVDTHDWAMASTDDITKNVMKNVKSGSILLFHDYVPKGAHTVEALRRLIPKLLEEGFEFVTVSELLEIEG